MKYIENWSDIPVGTKVIEDTYNEVYELFIKDGQPWLRQISWQTGNKPVPHNERPADFNPDCIYNQPWLIYDGTPGHLID